MTYLLIQLDSKHELADDGPLTMVELSPWKSVEYDKVPKASSFE